MTARSCHVGAGFGVSNPFYKAGILLRSSEIDACLLSVAIHVCSGVWTGSASSSHRFIRLAAFTSSLNPITKRDIPDKSIPRQSRTQPSFAPHAIRDGATNRLVGAQEAVHILADTATMAILCCFDAAKVRAKNPISFCPSSVHGFHNPLRRLFNH